MIYNNITYKKQIVNHSPITFILYIITVKQSIYFCDSVRSITFVSYSQIYTLQTNRHDYTNVNINSCKNNKSRNKIHYLLMYIENSSNLLLHFLLKYLANRKSLLYFRTFSRSIVFFQF